MSDATFRWGVMGTGNIARQFCDDLKHLPNHEVSTVASRSATRAADFCQTYGGTPVEGYANLLSDPGINGIYLTLPNSMHAEWATKALKAGFPVLCEKPMATSLAEAEAMFAAADKAKQVLVEAFMYRVYPQTKGVVQAVREGKIGTVRSIRAAFSYRTNKIDGNIRFDPDLAGGALMDVGVYCLDFSNLIADSESTRVEAMHRKHERGPDVMTSGFVEYANGVQATFTCGMDAPLDNALIVSGTDGYLTVDWPWKPRGNPGFTIAYGVPPKQDNSSSGPRPPERIDTPNPMPLYAMEAKAFADAVAGKCDPFMPRDASLRLAKMLESARASAATSS